MDHGSFIYDFFPWATSCKGRRGGGCLMQNYNKSEILSNFPVIFYIVFD